MIATTSIYDEISSFIASMNPEKVIQFRPSDTQQNRLDDLLDKQKETGLTLEEKTELEHYLIINRIVGLAKARAINILNKTITMSNEAKNSILYNEPDITVEPHHLNDDEAALIAAYIKRLKQNNRRKALYAKKTQSVLSAKIKIMQAVEHDILFQADIQQISEDFKFTD